MYVPKHFALDDHDAIVMALRATAFGHLVSATAEAGDEVAAAVGGARSGLVSTPLPFLVNDDLTELRAHVAKANQHWRRLDGQPAMLIVPTADAYVSPRWYESKSDDGRVVPTWNYEVIHLHGTVTIDDSEGWKRRMVSDLTDRNEDVVTKANGGVSWSVDDAPDDFIDGQLRAIVGIRFSIVNVEAKQKLSQNRTAPDRHGAARGLAGSARPGDRATAALMTEIEQQGRG